MYELKIEHHTALNIIQISKTSRVIHGGIKKKKKKEKKKRRIILKIYR
jgi:hypothetical protein